MMSAMLQIPTTRRVPCAGLVVVPVVVLFEAGCVVVVALVVVDVGQLNLYDDIVKDSVGFPCTQVPPFVAGWRGHPPQVAELDWQS
jgi:hypothetical protein